MPFLAPAVSTDGTVEMRESVPLRYCAPDG
jgi:hypothetical protein